VKIRKIRGLISWVGKRKQEEKEEGKGRGRAKGDREEREGW
jgi:hypothetical protein